MPRHSSAEEQQEVLRRYAEALEVFGRYVHAVKAEQWSAPTPCTDWSVRELVNHLTVEQLWAPEMVGGAAIGEVGDRFDGDVLGDDPLGRWDAAAAAALAAFTEPGAVERTVHLSYGDRSGLGYCREMTVDAIVHGWDLAEGIHVDSRMSDAAAEFALAEVTPYVPALAASGLFAAPVPVPSGADTQTRLLGLVGRDPAAPFGANGG
jgi:uncharacterized protein (TIGR03086 family)